MADTNTETHADIIAEMRERCIDEQHSPTLWPYFARLEAAHRREIEAARREPRSWEECVERAQKEWRENGDVY